jgi:hypothetical protein
MPTNQNNAEMTNCEKCQSGTRKINDNKKPDVVDRALARIRARRKKHTIWSVVVQYTPKPRPRCKLKKRLP